MGAKGAVEILHRKADPDERAELEAAQASAFVASQEHSRLLAKRGFWLNVAKRG